MGILAICLAVIPSKEELLSEGIKKAVSNDLVDISIPPAKITGEEGKRKILYTVIVDNKSEYLMRDLKVYIRPEEMVRQNLLPYENIPVFSGNRGHKAAIQCRRNGDFYVR